MKCDVCGTKIPLGTNECPNCGYKMKTSSVQSFDASGKTHEHIQSQKTPSYHATKLNDVIVNTKRKIRPSHVKKSKFSGFKALLIAVIVLVMVGNIAVPIFINNIGDHFSSEEVGNFDDMSFQDIIDEGYDDGTVQKALDERIKTEEFVSNELGLEDIQIHEYCDQYSEELYTSFYVEGSYKDVLYQIKCSKSSNTQSHYEMLISGSSSQSVRDIDHFPLDEDITNKIGEYIQVYGAYNLISSNCLNMEKDNESEDRYVYSRYENPYMYLSESHYSEYHFYFSVSND